MDAIVNARPVEILLVEDNPADVRLTEETLREGKVANCLRVVDDGQKAMNYLRREGQYAAVLRPDLVLLDLNLPGKDGREVLAEIKADPDLRHIPVVVVTGSIAEEDIYRAYALNCNCYVTKPIDAEDFVRVVENIHDFWLAIVTLPAGESAGSYVNS